MRILKKSNNRGFTIIEIIVVVSLMLILSAMVTPLYRNYVDKARQAKAISVGELICSAALWSYKDQKYEIRASKLKEDIEELTSLSVQEVSIGVDKNLIILYFLSDRKNYVAELNTITNSHTIKERDKGIIIYD